MKSTYSAVVRVPAEHVALMSAIPTEDTEGAHDAPAGKKVFRFNQVSADMYTCLSWPCLHPPLTCCTFAFLHGRHQTCCMPLSPYIAVRRLDVPGCWTSGPSVLPQCLQPVPIPSYLLALAVGDLESRRIGPRSQVWSEPSVVDAAAYEFANTDKYLTTGDAQEYHVAPIPCVSSTAQQTLCMP